MPKLSEEKRKEIAKYFTGVISQAENNRSGMVDDIKEYWSRHFGEYSCKDDKSSPFVGASDIQTGVIKISDAVLEARFYAALNTLKFCSMMANTTKESNESAKKLEGFINNYWKHKSDVITVLADAFQYNVVEGSMFLDIVPDNIKTKKKKKYKRGMIQGMLNRFMGYISGSEGNLEIEDVPVTDFIGAKWKNRPTLKILYDNSASTIQDCQWIALEYTLTPSQIYAKQKNEGWYDVDQIIDPKTLNILPESQTPTETESEEKNDYSGFEDTLSNKKKFYSVWCKYDVNNDGEMESFKLEFFKDNMTLVHDEQDPLFNGRFPVVSSPFYRIAGRIQGQGQPQRLAALNDEYDTLHNQAIDNNSIMNSMCGTAIPQKGFEPDKLKIILGKFIPVMSHDAIKMFDFTNRMIDTQYIGNAINVLIERTSLVSDYSMGRESQTNKNPTARGTAMILREMSMNLTPMMQNFQIALVAAVKQTLDCIYEFMPAEGIKYTRTDTSVDENGQPKESSEDVVIRREDLEYRDEFEITVLSGAVEVMLDAERQTAMLLMQMFANDQSGEINVSAIKKNALETIAPRQAKEIWRSPQEVQMLKMIQAKAQELQQREAMVAQTEQALNEAKAQVIGEHARNEEQRFIMDMERQGIPPEKQQELIAQFRQQFINRKMAERNGNQPPVPQPKQMQVNTPPAQEQPPTAQPGAPMA
jgi:hypothetical protein